MEEIFHQALEQPPEERDRWVQVACAGDADLEAEVSSLLKSDSAARQAFISANVRQSVVNLWQEAAPAMDGRRIGPWRIIRELGRGGMGAVYLADRADQQYESQAAIKLVRPGLDTDFILRRFRRERQILARLEHPNITRMFDGGTTDDGVPYLVMEYIDGLWITRYASAHNLSTEERVRLCLPVCAAVAYAHRNFIVHRDLKPGNILIDAAGVPKLLDFGISKLLHSDSAELAQSQAAQSQAPQTQAQMMTPDYASPEQILGDPVTVASDIYSLGAVLYELLTGVRPHRIDAFTPLALERAICLDPVTPPSVAAANDRALARRLKGDLDNIILRAMQKEPERRYASVEHFAGDLQRFLDHRPVLARPDSVGYRAGKFLRRHRLPVALGSAALLAVLTVAAVAVEQARIARERFQDVRKLATTFLFDIEEAARALPGSTSLRQSIARTGVEYLSNLSRASARDWDLKRELADGWVRIGLVQGGAATSNLSDPVAALDSFARADRLLGEVLRHDPSDKKAALERTSVLSETSEVERGMGRFHDATVTAETGLRIAESLLADDPKNPDLLKCAGEFHLDLARLRQQDSLFDVAEREAEAGARLLLQVAEAKPENREAQLTLAEVDARLGAVQTALGRKRDALANFRKGAGVLEEMCRRNPNDTRTRRELMFAYSHIGDMLGNPDYDNLGDLPGALAAYQKMAGQAKFLYDADQADARALGDYGIALLRLGIATPAGPLKRETLEHSRELLNRAWARNPKNQTLALHKAWVETELGDYQTAIATAERTLSERPNDSNTLRRMETAVRELAEKQAQNGQRTEALATLQHALVWGKKLDASAPPQSIVLRPGVALAWQTAGSVYATLAAGETGTQAAADREQALLFYQRAFDQWKKLEKEKGFFAPYPADMEAARQALAPGGLNRKAEGHR